MSESLESPGGLEGLGGPQDSFETTDISELPEVISEPVTSTITSSTSSKRSSVYQHFTFDEKNKKWKCRHCRVEYKPSKDSSTGTMLKHLRTNHASVLGNSEKTTGEIDRYLIKGLEKVVCHIFILGSNFEHLIITT